MGLRGPPSHSSVSIFGQCPASVDITIPCLAITECGRPPASWEVEFRTSPGLESRGLRSGNAGTLISNSGLIFMLELMSSKSDSHLVRARPGDANVLSVHELH